MESIKSFVGNIVNDAPLEIREGWANLLASDRAAAIMDLVNEYNAEVDEEGMEELPCPICHGKGRIEVFDAEKIDRRQEACRCMKPRRALRYVKGLGLLKDVQKCSFDSFVPYDDITEDMKQLALDFIHDWEGKWLFLGGQSGAGKTHLAYACLGQMVKEYHAPRWMRWIQDSQKIKRLVTDEDEYDREVIPLQQCEILIIDDLFNKPPTEADIQLARTIIDDRYCNDRCTIITSECLLGQINKYDDAIAGRIAEKSMVFQVRGDKHNYRMRDYL